MVYPALFAYLWFGINWLNGAVSLSIGLMALVVVQWLFHLRRGRGRARDERWKT